MPKKVIREEIFEACAKEILEDLKLYYGSDPGPIQHFANIIYQDVLIKRRPREKSEEMYKFYFESKDKEYQKMLSGLKFRKPVKFGEPGAWFGFFYGTDRKSIRPREQLNKYNVLFKEYFTFVPTSTKYETVWNEIIKFVELLPSIHEALYDLNELENDYIQFKVPSGLYLFITHPDSLVIHYRNKEIGPAIRKVVETVYANAGVQLTRELRSGSGFDFYLETPDGERLGQSHSELIARVIAKHLWEYREAIINWPAEKLADFLKDYITRVSEWDINKFSERI